MHKRHRKRITLLIIVVLMIYVILKIYVMNTVTQQDDQIPDTLLKIVKVF